MNERMKLTQAVPLAEMACSFALLMFAASIRSRCQHHARWMNSRSLDCRGKLGQAPPPAHGLPPPKTEGAQANAMIGFPELSGLPAPSLAQLLVKLPLSSSMHSASAPQKSPVASVELATSFPT